MINTIDIVTTREAAEILDCDDETIRRMCEDGRIECARFGRMWAVSRSSLAGVSVDSRRSGPHPLTKEEVPMELWPSIDFDDQQTERCESSGKMKMRTTCICMECGARRKRRTTDIRHTISRDKYTGYCRACRIRVMWREKKGEKA